MSYAPRIDKIDSNYVINGNMDYWQRGASFATSSIYTADRMFCVASTVSAMSVTRSSDVPNSFSTYSLSMAATTATNPRVEHKIESSMAQRLMSKTVTIQVKVKVTDSTGTPIQITTSYPSAVDNYASSTFISTDVVNASPTAGSWQTYRVQVALPPGIANGIRIQVMRPSVSAVTTTTLVSQLMLVEGSFTNELDYAYAAKNLYSELQLCQRYYEKSYPIETPPGTPANSFGATVFTSANANGGGTILTVQYKVKKRIIPTAVGYSTGTGTAGQMRNATNATDLLAGVNNVGETGFGFANGATGITGNVYAFHWTADAEIN